VETIRIAPFGTLFGVSFVVGAVFHLTMAILGVVLAFLTPGLFQANGQAVTSPLQAVGVVLFLAIIGLAANTLVAGAGSLIWIGLRKLLPKD
jgi:nitric oxide reductase large subunit